MSITALFTLGLFACVHNVYAATAASPTFRTSLDALGGGLGLSKNLDGMIGTMIMGVLGLLGLVALLLVIYAGFTLLISQGDPTKITKAKNILIWAVVGLVVIFASYLIVKYIIFTGILGTNTSNSVTPAQRDQSEGFYPSK